MGKQDDIRAIEAELRSAGIDIEGKSDPFETEPNHLRRHLDDSIEEYILEAAQSRQSEINLAMVARNYGASLDTVKAIAADLLKRTHGVDAEREEFNEACRQVKRIEETCADQGLREWKLQSLAKRYKRSQRQLMQAFEKALVNQVAIAPVSIKEFRESTSADTEFLVPGWLPLGSTVLLHADGGTGKTLFAYQLMAAIVTGQKWNGYPVEHGPVLLVQCDEPSVVTAERIDIRGIPDHAPLHIITDWQAEALPALAKYLEEHSPKLVIVDSLTTINKNCMFSENDTEYARPLLHLRDLADRHNCTFLIIHHSNASGTARGTRAIHNSVSEVWYMKQGDKPSERLLQVQKVRLGRPPGTYLFHFDESDMSFTYWGEEESESGSFAATDEKIRLWLSEDSQRGTPYSVEEIGHYLNLNKNTARKRLYELWSLGTINRKRSKTGRGYVYFVTGVNNSSDPSDPSDPPQIRTDHLADHLAKPDTASDTAPSDPLLPKNDENSAPKTQKPGSVDHFSLKPASVGSLSSDPSSDLSYKRSDHLDQLDHFTGDLFANCEAKINGVWYQAELVKEFSTGGVPWFEVRVSGKKYQIPHGHYRQG